MGEETRKCINVLALDGGGIRGLIPATILTAIEQKVGRPIHETFDLIAGTSTGGIIAVAIGAGANNGAPYRPVDLVKLYLENGPEIFKRGVFTDLRKWFGPKYSPDALERTLLKFFGETELASAKVPLLIGSYDLENQIPFFFKSQRVPANPNYNWKLCQVARATSAAPTFFPPVQVKNTYHESYTLVDGGVCINNPAMAAYAEARHIYGEADFLVASIGTGDRQDGLRYAEVKGWGLAQWAKQIGPVFMDSTSETADQELYFLLGRHNHFRLQAELKYASNEMDCVTPENMQNLQKDAQACLQDAKNAARFDELCTLLKTRPRPVAIGVGV
jgi:patatin-like phospholipase/acyl hydrolase